MREIRLHGSEGGGAETNRSFLPLSGLPVYRSTGLDPYPAWHHFTTAEMLWRIKKKT